MVLKYHTFMGEFSGATADEVVDAYFRDANTGPTQLDFTSWWNRQGELLRHFEQGLTLPDPQNPQASSVLLAALVRHRVLEEGPRDPDQGPVPPVAGPA